MKEIKAYKLSNGEIVENKEEAERVEKKITFEKKAWMFANKHGAYGDNIDAIGYAIINNMDELREILGCKDEGCYTKKEVGKLMFLTYNKRSEDGCILSTKEFNMWVNQMLDKDN